MTKQIPEELIFEDVHIHYLNWVQRCLQYVWLWNVKMLY